MADLPTLAWVLLPGLDGTGLMFEPLVERLGPAGAVVVRYPPEAASYADCVAHARASLPRDHPYLLLGESFSGPVAAALAAEAPPGLAGLVLCATFASNPRPGLGWTRPLVRALPPGRLPLPFLAWLLLGPWATPALLDLARRLLGRTPAATLKARLLAAMAVDASPQLRRVQVPILALCARQDRLVPAAAGRRLRALRPDLACAVLDGPHWLLQARPMEAIAAVTHFMEKRPEGSPPAAFPAVSA